MVGVPQQVLGGLQLLRGGAPHQVLGGRQQVCPPAIGQHSMGGQQLDMEMGQQFGMRGHQLDMGGFWDQTKGYINHQVNRFETDSNYFSVTRMHVFPRLNNSSSVQYKERWKRIGISRKVKDTLQNLGHTSL